ncbi:DUF2489 domain-containing protein [Pseudomonas sp.]|uniref:DUF2489 domain-containing protein n=1 Tax=Pseudomonas sp. TaxID=306 RepID=UPI001A00DB9A|nr:DUF2489 domain-containing protein [Pseudomonas sp.]MBF0676385.1 DUF2489 domain-containing protein [Pseudomonas sp.]
MSPALVWSLLALALLIIAGLAAYALWLWRRVWHQQRRQTAAEQRHHEQLGGDLRILAGSLLDEQLPLIEGAIRIKVLMDNYDPQLSQDPRCAVFHQLYAATAHVPTHGDWKALDRRERQRYRSQFSELELQHKAAVRAASRWLLNDALIRNISP